LFVIFRVISQAIYLKITDKYNNPAPFFNSIYLLFIADATTNTLQETIFFSFRVIFFLLSAT